MTFSGVCCFFGSLFGLVLRKSTSLKPEWGCEVDKPSSEAKEATSLRRSTSSGFFDLVELDFTIVACGTKEEPVQSFGEENEKESGRV